MNSQLPIDQAIDRGAFLARLSRLFGRPAPRVGGFEYFIQDMQTGLELVAYCGAHGPCYGGQLADRQALAPVLAALEDLLMRTLPVNCAFAYRAKPELGGGMWVTGCNAGRTFDVPDRRTRRVHHRLDRRAP